MVPVSSVPVILRGVLLSCGMLPIILRGVLLSCGMPGPTELELPRWGVRNTLETFERLYRTAIIFHPAATDMATATNVADHVNDNFSN